jgi:paraquat-inducible protein A
VNAASGAIAALSVLFLGGLAWRVRHRMPGAPRALALHVQGVAGVCLLVGLSAPMLTVVAQSEVAVLGNVVLQFEAKSILGTVRDLFIRGSAFVACLLALFSVVVPVAKLVVSLLALLAPGAGLRTACVKFVRAVGKWSMTDVFVVAVLLAFLAGGGGELTDARLGPGLYYFAADGLLSLAGGVLLARVASDVAGPEGAPAGLPPH